MYNQKIYKKYIGQFEELANLKKWYLLYHHTILKIFDGSKDEDYINSKLGKLEILYKYKSGTFKFKEIDVIKLDNYRVDFLEQYAILENKEYDNFNELENDKLILFNIIEAYFAYITHLSKSNKYCNFIKQSKNCIDKMIPKSKLVKILNRIFQKMLYYTMFIVSYIIIALMIFLLNLLALAKAVNFINYLPRNILVFLANLGTEKVTSFLFSIVIYLSFLLSIIITTIIIIKSRKLIEKISPRKEIAFARDLSENRNMLSTMSIIISIFALLSSIVIAIFSDFI